MTTRYWLGRDGKRLGPYEEAEILKGVETGVVQATDLLWVDGMRRGIPVWEVLAQLGAAGPSFPGHGRARSTQLRPGARGVDADIGLESVRYAGFWMRLAAVALDTAILWIADVAIAGIVLVAIGHGGGVDALWLTLALVVGWLYFAFMESSPGGATFGKRAFRLQVLTADRMQRIGFLRATGRWAGRWVSAIALLGYLVQPFTARRQALHDLLSGTVVVARGERPRVLLAVVVLCLAPMIFGLMLGGALKAYELLGR